MIETPILAGMPCSGMGVPGVRYTPPEGAKRFHCGQCKCEIWLGVKQQAYLQNDQSTPTVCVPCLQKSTKGVDVKVSSLGGISGTYSVEGN